jgi:hypothetical protein
LDEFKDKYSKLQYAKLVKMYPKLIKSQRGGKLENRGYYMDLHLLLKLSAMLDKELEVQIYDIFINGKILQLRDQGGEEFKRLNILIDTLEDRRESTNNKFVYMHVAKLVNEKVNMSFKAGWNDEQKGEWEQSYRTEILKQLSFSIEMGFVRTYGDLKDTIERLS